jgi:hypothetical protein
MTLTKLMFTYVGFWLAGLSRLPEAQCPYGNFDLGAHRNQREHAVELGELTVNSVSPSLGIVSEAR